MSLTPGPGGQWTVTWILESGEETCCLIGDDKAAHRDQGPCPTSDAVITGDAGLGGYTVPCNVRCKM